jgi:hypothetical protein
VLGAMEAMSAQVHLQSLTVSPHVSVSGRVLPLLTVEALHASTPIMPDFSTAMHAQGLYTQDQVIHGF